MGRWSKDYFLFVILSIAKDLIRFASRLHKILRYAQNDKGIIKLPLSCLTCFSIPHAKQLADC
jgi:hypothetical protein